MFSCFSHILTNTFHVVTSLHRFDLLFTADFLQCDETQPSFTSLLILCWPKNDQYFKLLQYYHIQRKDKDFIRFPAFDGKKC